MIVTTLVTALSLFAEGPSRKAPIGVFDSGTGGLTVLEQILTVDAFTNGTDKAVPDGIPDLAAEDFIYLADQANMPYGRYDAEGKADFLRSLALRDAEFILGGRYYKKASQDLPTGRKEPCKIVVIACNTATAYGLDAIDAMLESRGDGIKVLGVINAGVKATYDILSDRKRPLSIGVMATPGTISSGAYERTLMAQAAERGLDAVTVINQPGYGFAEAVDNEPEYVDASLTAPRRSYRGPELGEGDADINPSLMGAYNFDASGLLEDDGEFQLNSAANYARFNFVSLVERYRISGASAPLDAVILGCTHYPFLLETLHQMVKELREYHVGDVYPYRALLPEELIFVDPAQYLAMECYSTLLRDGLLKRGRNCHKKSPRTVRGFISVPYSGLDPELLGPGGGLKYEFKYGRDVEMEDIGTRVVPFSRSNIDAGNRARIERLLPACSAEILP